VDSTQRKITKYLRDAVISQKTQQIEVTEKSFKIPFSMLDTGKIQSAECQCLFEGMDKQAPYLIEKPDVNVGEEEKQDIKVIIATQVVNVKAEGGVKHESPIADLTGTFFLPASLSKKGILMPGTDSIPWIPRDFLSPVMDDALIVGEVQKVDAYISAQTKELSDIKNSGNWEKYISFVKNFWKSVNDTEFYGDFIYNYAHGKQPLFLDNFSCHEYWAEGSLADGKAKHRDEVPRYFGAILRLPEIFRGKKYRVFQFAAF
jgi:hypothetical protein